MASARDVAVAVLGKISNLLVQEPDSVLGVEDHIEQIECILQEKVYTTGSVMDEDQAREVLYDIEDAIDELVIRATYRRKRISFFPNALTSGDLPKHFFCALAIEDLIDHHKIHNKLKYQKPSDFFNYYDRILSRKHYRSRKFLFGFHCREKISRKEHEKEKLKEILSEIEDDIDELIMKATNKRKRITFMDSVLGSVDFEKRFFYVLALSDLVDHYKIRKQLEKLKHSLSYRYYFDHRPGAGTWKSSFGLDLITASTITLPVISKLEGMVAQELLISPSVRKLARWLKDDVKSLHDFIKEAEADSKELSEEGMVWIEELCDVCRSAENVVGLFMDYQQQRMKNNGSEILLRNLIFSPRNFISQRRLANQMARIKEKILSLSDRKYGAFPNHPSLYHSYSDNKYYLLRAGNQLDIPGFDEDVDEVTTQLLKDDPRCITISIVGVKGIGKTVLAKLIYNSQAIAHHFPYRFWVSGESMSRYDIMQRILGVTYSDVRIHSNETWESYDERLMQMVNAHLTDKLLIVITVSYISEFWRSMGKAFRELSNGTRIIFVVDRLQGAPPVTETDFTYRLHLRSDDESWALFTHNLNKEIPLELEKNFKEDILRKCGGLPNVIMKLGRQLSWTEATLEEWKKEIDQLIKDEDPWSEILKELNKHLPLYLRRCVFYFGLFPGSYMIPARRLIALWVAEGLGRQQDDSKHPEYVAEECLKELVNHNMVQVTKKKLNGKIRTCCLPEPLRVHWYANAKKATFLQGHTDKIGGVRRLVDHLDSNDPHFDHIHGNNSTFMYTCYSSVVSFLSFDTREQGKGGEDIGNFLDRCISRNCFHFLWVLDLECVFEPKLPEAASQLTRLKYLGLRSTYLKNLPIFIDKLLSLQKLDLKRTCISELPSSIWKVTNLRHLFLDESYRSKFVPRQDDKTLVELQTLWGLVIDEYSPVKNGLDTMSNITKLGLKCKISEPSKQVAMSSQLLTVANWIENLKQLQSLRLKSFDESNQPWDLHLKSLSSQVNLTSMYLVGKLKNQQLLSEFPKNLIELTLSASGLAEDPMQTLDKFPNLRIVILLLGSFTGEKMMCKFGGFPKLEILKFKKLVQLEQWDVEEGALTSLKSLEIESCSNLKMLPDGLRLVRMLREVKLTKLPMLSARLKNKQGEDWDRIAHVRNLFIDDQLWNCHRGLTAESSSQHSSFEDLFYSF